LKLHMISDAMNTLKELVEERRGLVDSLKA